MTREIISKQSTGDILTKLSKIDHHQYYCKTMNQLLLPHVKIISNIFMEEVISTNNTSGEYLILRYHKHIDLENRNSYVFIQF